MKNRLLFATLFFAACGNNQTTSQSTDTATATAPQDTLVTSCYSMVQNGDSAQLQLQTSGTVVKGNLAYHRNEKDNNNGSLEGIIRDSLIIADYTFQSEGKTSIRQVVFKMQADTLLEGYGDVDATGDTTKFKNVDQLQYMNNRPFIKTTCTQ